MGNAVIRQREKLRDLGEELLDMKQDADAAKVALERLGSDLPHERNLQGRLDDVEAELDSARQDHYQQMEMSLEIEESLSESLDETNSEMECLQMKTAEMSLEVEE